MTVHQFIKSMGLGEMRRVPSNCNRLDLVVYGYTRFGYALVNVGRSHIKRVCRTCRR